MTAESLDIVYDIPDEEVLEDRHILAVLVDNEFGVLNRVAGLFSARGYNIVSLTVAEVDAKRALSRITVVTRGSAANSDFKKASDDWRDTFVDNRDGKNKQKSFVQKFANKQIGSTNAKAIGYGDSSANAKTTIKKAANSAEGQAGAQSSTAAKYQGDNWHAA